jgi:transposase
LMDDGFLTDQKRSEMRAILRRGSTPQRYARRINAILLLDKGWSCADVAEALFLDDDTIRDFYKSFVAGGLAGLELFESGGSECRVNDEQIVAFVEWVDKTRPKSRKIAGAWLQKCIFLTKAPPNS